MSKLEEIESSGHYRFYCLGCEGTHVIPIGRPEDWQWNGDFEKPTITPSVLIRSGHYMPEYDGGSCWCTYNTDHPEDPVPFKCVVCHSYVTDGNIQYLNDCTHALAGQTLPLPELESTREVSADVSLDD